MFDKKYILIFQLYICCRLQGLLLQCLMLLFVISKYIHSSVSYGVLNNMVKQSNAIAENIGLTDFFQDQLYTDTMKIFEPKTIECALT